MLERSVTRTAPAESIDRAVLALGVVSGKWKVRVLIQLLDRDRHFGELQRDVPAITPRVLARQLRDLEADGLLTRTVHRGAPLRVEYSLTDLGRSLQPLIVALSRWGEIYRATVTAATDR